MIVGDYSLMRPACPSETYPSVDSIAVRVPAAGDLQLFQAHFYRPNKDYNLIVRTRSCSLGVAVYISRDSIGFWK